MSTVAFCLIKELNKAQIQRQKPLFKYLRWPKSEVKCAEKFLTDHPNLVNQKKIDHKYNDELLSIDGYIGSDEDGELALSFLKGNQSIVKQMIKVNMLFPKKF